MCRMYGRDSEILLLAGNHKLASFTLVEECIHALIRIKEALRRIAICLRQRASTAAASIARYGAGLCTLTHAGRAGGAVAYPRRRHVNVRRCIDMAKEFL